MRKVAAFGLKLFGQIAVKINPNLKSLPAPDYEGQQANDFLRRTLEENTGGLIIGKLGTDELKARICFHSHKVVIRKTDIHKLLCNKYVLFCSTKNAMNRPPHNAGFFPTGFDLC